MSSLPERQRLVSDAIILERAARVLAERFPEWAASRINCEHGARQLRKEAEADG